MGDKNLLGPVVGARVRERRAAYAVPILVALVSSSHAAPRRSLFAPTPEMQAVQAQIDKLPPARKLCTTGQLPRDALNLSMGMTTVEELEVELAERQAGVALACRCTAAQKERDPCPTPGDAWAAQERADAAAREAFLKGLEAYRARLVGP